MLKLQMNKPYLCLGVFSLHLETDILKGAESGLMLQTDLIGFGELGEKYFHNYLNRKILAKIQMCIILMQIYFFTVRDGRLEIDVSSL